MVESPEELERLDNRAVSDHALQLLDQDVRAVLKGTKPEVIRAI